MIFTGLGIPAFHCYPVLKAVIGCIPFFLKWEEMVEEGGTKMRSSLASRTARWPGFGSSFIQMFFSCRAFGARIDPDTIIE